MKTVRKLLMLSFLIPAIASANNINVVVNTNVVPALLERNTLTPVFTHHFVQIDNYDDVGRDFYIMYYHCFANVCWSKDKEIRVKPRENFVEDFYYPQNIKLEKSGRYAVAAFTKVSGKPIRTFVKVDKGIIMVK